MADLLSYIFILSKNSFFYPPKLYAEEDFCFGTTKIALQNILPKKLPFFLNIIPSLNPHPLLIPYLSVYL